MNFECNFCSRTFSRRSAYSQHVQVCMIKAESISDEEYNRESEEDNEECSNFETDTQSNEECEMDDNENNNIEAQDMSLDSIESELISEMSTMSFEDVFESDTLDANLEFPNEPYKDLMLLVTNNKLSNKVGNEIIKFFNKHSNLATSPLPKNIKTGRKFMDNMKIPSLEFDKVLITRHNDKDYFLHHQNLINCIKNILAVPGITKDFALSFENYKVKMLI